MTNEQAKQEAIKKAYGNHYEKCDPDEDGWTRFEFCSPFSINPSITFIDTTYFNVSGDAEQYWRPAELKYIEDNNGWIRIENDLSNLPDEKMDEDYDGYMVLLEKPSFGFNMARHASLRDNNHNGIKITHYMPIKPYPSPIY